MTLLEVAHGCFGAEPLPLSLAAPNEPAVVLGVPPPPGSFVEASGRSVSIAGGGRRDLFVLRTPVTALSVLIGPTDAERCIKEIRAFGWRRADR